jgi:hypothetical protein
VIDDFYNRNIADRANEKTSDYLLGHRINDEIELRDKLNSLRDTVLTNIKDKLRNEYGVTKANPPIQKICKNKTLKEWKLQPTTFDPKKNNISVDDLSDFVKSDKSVKASSPSTQSGEYDFVKRYYNDTESLLHGVLDIDIAKISKITNIHKADEDTEAIRIDEKTFDSMVESKYSSYSLYRDAGIKLEFDSSNYNPSVDWDQEVRDYLKDDNSYDS